MSIIVTCPACGLESPEIRCPRCNALKVQGCSGMCSSFASSCETGTTPPAPGAPHPSDEATADGEHPGTPLSR